jgi:Cytochrome P460
MLFVGNGRRSLGEGNAMTQSPANANRSSSAAKPDEGDATMKKSTLISLSISVWTALLAAGVAISAQDRYTVQVPNGLAFSEFRGYEDWPVIAISENGGKIAVILGNPVMIDAYKTGVPGNGKSFPDGAKMAKIHWNPKKQESYPGQPTVPGAQHDVDFMVKDSKRFADSGGWGYGAFEYDAASDTFSPATVADNPPQENDAKCGFACHTVVKNRDYVFTEYGKR